MAPALDRARDALLVERLHAKSVARGLAWTCAEHEGRFQTQLGEFVIEVGDGADGCPEILICDAAGRAIELLTPELVEADEDALTARRRMFIETHEAARRMAMGVDQVIEALIDRLG